MSVGQNQGAHCRSLDKYLEQAGAELDQAQYKLGLDFNLIFCRFGLSRFGLVELVRWI